MKQKLMNTRENYNIELIRVLACFFVIGAHYCMNHRVEADGTTYNMSVVLIDAFTHCGAQAFFVITGFFLFNRDKEWKELLRYIIIKILVPTYVFLFLGNLLNDYVCGTASLWQCVLEVRVNWAAFAHTIVHWSNDGINGFHLWFMFSLVQIYLLYPVLKLLCKEDRKIASIRRYVWVVCCISLSVKPMLDAMFGRSLFFMPMMFSLWPVVYVLGGYELKIWHSKLSESVRRHNSFWLFGLVLYVLGCFGTFLLSYFIDIGNNGIYSEIFVEPYMFGLLIATIGLVLFCMSVHIPRGKIAKGIQYLGSKTFVAYLVHVLVQRRLITLGFESWIAGFVKNNYLHALICVSGYFIVSILLAAIWDETKKLYVVLTSDRQKENVVVKTNS